MATVTERRLDAAESSIRGLVLRLAEKAAVAAQTLLAARVTALEASSSSSPDQFVSTVSALQTSAYTALYGEMVDYNADALVFDVTLSAGEANKVLWFHNSGTDVGVLGMVPTGADTFTDAGYVRIDLRVAADAVFSMAFVDGHWKPSVPESDVTTEKSADYTAKLGEFVPVDDTSNAVSITIPSAVGAGGQTVAVKHNRGASTNTVTVVGTIDGITNPTLSPLETLVAKSDNTNWMRTL